MYYLKGEEYASIVAHHYEQGEVWDRTLKYLIRAAQASKTTFDNFNAANFYTKALEISQRVDDLEPRTLTQIYAGRGRILKRLGKVDEARTDFEKALELAKANEDLITQMRALIELGKLHAGHEKFSQAAPYFEEALEIARQAKDKMGLVDALNQLGTFVFNMGELQEANMYFNEALEIAQGLGNTPRTATSQDGLATIVLHQGEIDASIARLEQIAKTWRNIGNYQGFMKTSVNLAIAYNWQANYEQGDQTCADALIIQERTGDLSWAPNLSYYLAQNAFARGELSTASKHLSNVTKISQQLGNGIRQSVGLSGGGYFNLTIGQTELASVQIEEAVRVAKITGSPLWISRARRILGVAHRFTGNLAQAQTILEEELAQMKKMGFCPDQVEILGELLEVYAASNQWDKVSPALDYMFNLVTTSDMKASQAKALIIKAKLANHRHQYEQSLDHLLEARNIAQTTGDKLIEIVAEIDIAKAQLDLGHPSRARVSLDRAEQLLQEVTATLGNEELEHHFLTTAPLAVQLKAVQQAVGVKEE
jgi:tetratricopeptide (TPR) repeat protein